MKTIALTGATSMLGIALINECIRSSVRVIAFVRPFSKRIDRLPKSDLIIVVSSDLDSLKNAPVEGLSADVFYHIAWSHTDRLDRNSPEKQCLNIQYTLDAVALAERLGCSRFIGTGSQAEYGRVDSMITPETPINPEVAYGIAKYAAGKLSRIECERRGIGYVWVRVFSVYGLNDNEGTLVCSFIEKCKSNEHMPLTPCTQIWDFLHELDAGSALFLLGDKGVSGRIYCLGSGEGRPLSEYLTIAKEIINTSYDLRFGEIPFPYNQVMHLCADNTTLKEDTGWCNRIDFASGIVKMMTGY